MDARRLLHDTTSPYDSVPYEGIEYSTCKDFDHISRYRRLRQIVHYLETPDRFTTLELQNGYDYSGMEFDYYVVGEDRENRLDLVSYDYYGTPSYAWAIAYVNGIEDGYSVMSGRTLKMPKVVTELFKNGSVLSAVPATSLNLGEA